jgi:hypothetical protein
MILVTGRIFDDLEASFPGLWPEFDALVTETAPCCTPEPARGRWPSPVDPAVRGALADHGVAARAGRVLLALAGEDASTAVDVIAGPGLDCQVIRNRGAAMILPAGVTKGTGLLAARTERRSVPGSLRTRWLLREPIAWSWWIRIAPRWRRCAASRSRC